MNAYPPQYPINNQQKVYNVYNNASLNNYQGNAQNTFEEMNGQPKVNQQIELNNYLAQGFGAFMMNLNDSSIRKANVPKREKVRYHLNCIIATIILVVMVSVSGAGLNKFLNKIQFGLILGFGYLGYILISIILSSIRGFITNIYKFQEYKLVYDGMTSGKGYFTFFIQCYHYRTVRTKNGTRRQKVVTHVATQRYNPIQSVDESGVLQGIQDITKYVFINYQKRFFFTNPDSEAKFNQAFRFFVAKNTRDCYQNYNHQFGIDGFQEEVGFTAMGSGSHNCILYTLFNLLGLSLPYSWAMERNISRYSINIVKRLTC